MFDNLVVTTNRDFIDLAALVDQLEHIKEAAGGTVPDGPANERATYTGPDDVKIVFPVRTGRISISARDARSVPALLNTARGYRFGLEGRFTMLPVRISDERDRPFRYGDRRFRQRDRSFRERDRVGRKAELALRMTSTTRAMLASFGRKDDARAPDEHAHVYVYVYERLPFAKQKCTLTGRWTAAVYPALMQCKMHSAGPDEIRLVPPL